jgi:septum site-determining protein MinC
MSASQKENPAAAPLIELKSSSFTLPILKLFGDDLVLIGEQLSRTVEQAPDFFLNTPIVMDLSPLAAKSGQVDFVGVVSLCRDLGMVPIGIRGGSQAHNRSAEALGMAILADSSSSRKAAQHSAPSTKPAASSEQVPPSFDNAALLVTQPIRSGQRVHAEGGDLIVTAHVSAGAEIIADGHIHVYGTLRGRALAGAKGDTASRIFCNNLQAELVAIAGQYQVSENMDDSVRGVPVQVYLENLSLMIHPL